MRLTFTPLGLALFCFVFVLPSFALSEGQRYALLIGVRQYDKNELRDLKYAEQDVTALAGVLKDGGYRRVVLMTQTEGANDAKRLPLSANIRTSIKGILEDRSEEDSVVVALAGHGVQFRGEEGSYFCPMDARLGDRRTLISLGDVYEALESSKAGLKVLLIDACRNDPQSDFSRSRRTVDLESITRPQKQKPPGGVAAYFSCASGERAFESPKLKHGVFFHFIIAGLRGRADLNRDDFVDLDELVLFTKQNVPDYVKDEFGDDYRQMPELVGKTYGVLPIVPVADPRYFRNSIGMKFALIPAGEFMMGIPKKNGDYTGGAHPPHKVRLTKPYYLGVYETTQDEYERVMGTNPSYFVKEWAYEPTRRMIDHFEKELKRNDISEEQRQDFEVSIKSMKALPTTLEGRIAQLERSFNAALFKEEKDIIGRQLELHRSFLDTRRHPVERVTWDDAVEFCRRLSAQPSEMSARRTYRLPTEAEWEYACRAGTTTSYYFGEALTPLQANVQLDSKVSRVVEERTTELLKKFDTASLTGWRDFRSEQRKLEQQFHAGRVRHATHRVGSYAPNAWGLFDMHGNVAEWCQDWYAGDYYEASPDEDPQGPSDSARYGELKVSRGGHWCSQAEYSRSGMRAHHGISGDNVHKHFGLGFRVVCELKGAFDGDNN